MVITALAFLGGIISLHQLPVLPNTAWIVIGVIVLSASFRFIKSGILFWFTLGFLWAWFQAGWLYQHSLPDDLEGADLQVTGEVITVPEKYPVRTRFVFRIRQAAFGERRWQKAGKVRLNWYGKHKELVPGQIWKLKVRLKKPNGFMNPSGFDYEGWLFQQGIIATGYVRKDPANSLLKTEWNLQKIRYLIKNRLQEKLAGIENRGLIMALALGMRGDIDQQQWRVLQRTGTGHLIAISGLHIGLVAGLCFLLGRFVWVIFPALCLRLPAQKAAAFFSIAGAVFYAFMAGLGIPAQRALVMIFVAMLSVLLDRSGKPAHVLSLALILVLFLDSSSVLAQGFWLSFSAVAILMYGMSCRLGPFRGWQSWGRAQWLISIGLIPLTLFLFQQTSLISPLANFIAIPWVSFLVVPLVLSGTLFLMFIEPVGQFLLSLSDKLLEPLQQVLHFLSDLGFAQWSQHSPSVWVLFISIIAIILLLAPRGMPLKRLGVVLVLPVFLIDKPAIPPGGLRFTLLDVGQGLASVIETRNHTLIFDTGPRFSDRFDTGSSVVLPYLRQQGINRIDSVIISHGDNDHRGGFDSVSKLMQIDRIYSGEPEKLASYPVVLCQRSMQWEWDGVTFMILHPVKEVNFRKNDRSCVLKVVSPGGSILLTGDIHRKSERYLIKHQRKLLSSDIMVAPHHGSKTSSMPGFIQAVNARYVLFPAGYRNRFHHPNRKTYSRYAQSGAILLDSARHGAIQISIDAATGISRPITYRQLLSRHWNRKAKPFP